MTCCEILQQYYPRGTEETHEGIRDNARYEFFIAVKIQVQVF
jgi:hypothetical protein